MHQPPFSDAELLESIRGDDASAFKMLYDRYWESLYLKACKRVDKDEAKDIVQEVMTTLWRRRREIRIDEESAISRYLHTAVKYRVISYYAHTATEIRNSDLFDVLSGQAAENPLEVKELMELLNQAIGQLPARMQQIFRMSRQDDISISDIARQLDLSEQTVKNQLTEALKRIRALVKTSDSAEWGLMIIILYGSTS